MLQKALSYLSLYGAHFLKLFTFIILLPHFANVLNPGLWGKILVIQSLSLWLQTVVEYGFNFSATRRMSVARNDMKRLASLISGVIGAKIFLSIIVSALVILVLEATTIFEGLSSMLWLAAVSAIVQGFTPIWYFTASEKFGRFANIDMIARVSYLLLCLSFIKDDNDGYLIFVFNIVVFAVANLIGYYFMFKEVDRKIPHLSDIIDALRDGAPMFIFYGITSVYTTLSVFILGLYQPATLIANYGTADRIVRSSAGLIDPINRVIFSRLSYLYKFEPKRALHMLTLSSILIASLGLSIFFGGRYLADFIINSFFPKYPDASEFIKSLLFYVPIVALNSILGLQIMLPLNMDKEFTSIFTIVSIFSFGAMVILVPTGGTERMIDIIILSELLVMILMVISILRSGKLRDALGRSSDGN
ncbi:oligosaccharide flippase family protein [Deinococcus soli (ex Cha et al. 2016)]|uniref:oligosaccharide flippase family protein n=1 Tax=Deinococcus soli (ex Cha et al. 2016) TaxID=1309411 RepID=UPI0019923B35|nr:oligosaccharide flippase family protein [Deinococcus soli (ex Cha et al. 2016)]GGB76782.1 transporter [Deinococcus soli (ex Cha et al. 2016)]